MSLGVFADNIRLLRLRQGLTQEDLAVASGVSLRTIRDIEAGRVARPRPSTVRLLADALGLSGAERDTFRQRALLPSTPSAPSDAADVGSAGPEVPHDRAPAELPRGLASFVGREKELALLSDTAASATADTPLPVYLIGGLPGVGKTALAVHAGHALAHLFPDGQFFVRLHGHTTGVGPADPGDVLRALLVADGVEAALVATLPDWQVTVDRRASLWRTRMTGRRALVILDDAASSQQVAPLLPPAAECLVLVTSRHRLIGLADAAVLELAPLSADEAVRLFNRLSHRHDAAHPSDDELAAVAHVVRSCWYLPLAVAATACRLRQRPAWRVQDLATELGDARTRLSLMRDEQAAVAAALDVSYRSLPAARQRLFRLLGLRPGTDIDRYAAAALGGTSAAAAAQHLQALYDDHLLTEPMPGWYRMHDLIAEYTGALVGTDPAGERHQALHRLLAYYRSTATNAARHICDPRATDHQSSTPAAEAQPRIANWSQAMAWFHANISSLMATAHRCANDGEHRWTIAIASATADFCGQTGRWNEAIWLHRAARAAAELLEDKPSLAESTYNLANVLRISGNSTEAAYLFAHALSAYRDIGDDAGQAWTLTKLGALRWETGDHAAALDILTKAHDIFDHLDNQLGRAHALADLAGAHLVAGDGRAAAGPARQALDLFRTLGDRNGQAAALNTIGGIQRANGASPEAISSFRKSLETFEAAGNRFGQAQALNNLGHVTLDTEEYPTAAEYLTLSVELSRAIGDRNGEAYALSGLGVALQSLTDAPAAIATVTQALTIFRETGDRRGEAIALTSMATILRHQERFNEAKVIYDRAANVARQTNHPSEEADALSAAGRCAAQLNDTTTATANLKEALKIYQRIGATARTAAVLDELRS